MALTREMKQQIIEELTRKLETSQVVIFTDYRGLTVQQMQDLRGRLGETDSEFKVVKNTLTRIALQQCGKPTPEELLTGPTAVLFLHDDIAKPTKTLLDFANEVGLPTVKGGLMGSQVLDEEAVKQLAELPTREEILAQLLAAIQGPAVNLVQVLEAPASELLRTLQAPLTELAMTIQAYANKQQQAA